MKNPIWLVCGVCVFLVSTAVGQENSIKTDTGSQRSSVAHAAGVLRGQPVSLFDGKSLAGWEKRNGKPSDNWIVQDGLLHRAKGGGDLYHKHWYRDFELSFEWKIQAGGNSGVKYRVQSYGKQMLGCEYQLQDDKGKPFSRQSTGALYAVQEPSKNKVQNPHGEWNRSKIVVCGSRIEHWLNDQLVVDLHVGSLDWLQRVGSSKFNDKTAFGQNREGRLFLQDHGNPVWFRNIILVPLDADASGCYCGGLR